MAGCGKCEKCKDCKWFQREHLSGSRSGWCIHEKWKDNKNYGGGKSYLMGCGTIACNDFQKKK